MKTILLTKGKYALVDDEDFDLLNKWKWSCDANGYAVRHEQKKEYGSNPRRMIKMHRFILKLTDYKCIDHINRDRLDNRKVNLRIATNSQNQANSTLTPLNSSGYRGVCKYNQDKPFLIKKPWGARITVNGKKIFRGMFSTKEEAAKIYNELAKRYFGNFASLNQI